MCVFVVGTVYILEDGSYIKCFLFYIFLFIMYVCMYVCLYICMCMFVCNHQDSA